MVKKSWFLPSELVVHNRIDDLWVCVHGKIFDLTRFVQKYLTGHVPEPPCGANLCNYQGLCICNASKEIRMTLALAGKNVSHWFEKSSTDYLTYTHAVTTALDVHAPHGTWPQLSGAAPSPKWRPPEQPFWFEDESLVVGYLTKNARPVKIINMLTGDSSTIEVCDEETIYEIMEHRYLPYNRHYSSYTWTFKGRPLALNRTLMENVVKDDRHCFATAGLSEDTHVPSILLYYNDDCTEDFPEVCRCLCD